MRGLSLGRGGNYFDVSFCKYTTGGTVKKRNQRFLPQFLKDALRTKHCRLELTCGQNLSRALLSLLAELKNQV